MAVVPHTRRRFSDSGFYHIVTKGDGGQIIFESDDDRIRYLTELEDAAVDTGVRVHAYCLMGNHIHLLMEDTKLKISDCMKMLDENYARYFGKRTGRVGHVFQGRFWSEAVLKDEHFLAVLRYIHANPEAAGICLAKEYPWSSYSAYMGADSFVSCDVALSLLGSPEKLAEFQASGCRFAKPFPGSNLNRHLAVDELSRIALEVLGRETLNTIKRLAPEKRFEHLTSLKRAGFSDSEIARVTGIGYTSVRATLHVADR